MPVTMREVAQRAGVSKATVSYVLNGRGKRMRIPDETRQRILEAVRELGYHPNALARSLAHRRTDTIAVVMQYPGLFSSWSGFTNELMRGVTDAAIELGYDLLLHTRHPTDAWSNPPAEIVEAEVATLTDGRVDGALMLRDADDPLAERLNRRGFPNVLMFTHSDQPDQWYVDCDNALGATLAVEHLFRLGHRRIVHLAGSPQSQAARDRVFGFRCAFERAGLPLEPAWIVEISDPTKDFSPVLRQFQEPPGSRPTAVFAWSDEVAIQAMRALREIGLRIPQDAAVIGFDSTALCDHTDPPLTSVRQPIYAMAARALRLLTEKIAGETPEATQILFPPELTARRSCGAGE